MPRHSSLIPLSHDHHHGLVLALRLKKGGPTTQKDAEVWPSELLSHARAAHHFFEHELLPHFSQEETHLFPVAALLGGAVADQIEELTREHVEMRRLFGEIPALLEQEDRTALTSLLPRIGEVLEKHIRREERILFPAMEEALSADQLGAISAGLQNARTQGS
jgi:iron-sulfur cluster repair protein YtfE (RIC family)